MKLPENKFIKVLIGLAGAVLLAAIGSGVWELALRPLSTVFRDMLLNLISFGVQSFRDDVYSRIAKGHDQSASVLLLLYFVMAMISCIIFLSLDMLSKRKEMKEERDKMLGEIDELIAEVESPEPGRKEKSSTEIKEELLELRQKTLRHSPRKFSLLVYLLIAVNFVLAVVLLFTAVSASYVNSAISHYNRLLAISVPYLEEQKRELINSQFAQIRCKEDYVKITSELECLITKKGIEPPQFSPW